MKTFLAQNQFISNPSVISPRTEGPAVALKPPPTADATAAPFSVSPGELLGLYQRDGEIEPSVMSVCAPGENPPSMTNGGDQEASAPAPTKNPDAGALGTEHIHELFVFAHGLARDYQPDIPILQSLLDEIAPFPMEYLPDYSMSDDDELPLFLREDGYLKRQA